MTRVAAGWITIPVSGLNGAGSWGAAGVVPYVVAIASRAARGAAERLACSRLGWTEACGAPAARITPVRFATSVAFGAPGPCERPVAAGQLVACGVPAGRGTAVPGAPAVRGWTVPRGW